MNGQGRPIAPVNIEATDSELKNHMIQRVQYSCQFHGLPSDDANKHLDKFLTITQSMKQNEEMASKFLSKYFPPSMVTKLRNDISNFCQFPDESLFEALYRDRLQASSSRIDRMPPNHNMLPVTQIDMFYNGLTLRHRDTINAATGGTFMKRSTTSSSFEIAALAQQMIEMRKDMIQMYRSNQQVNSITPICETCSGLHSYYECQVPDGYTQDVYATTRNYNSAQPNVPSLEEMMLQHMRSIEAKMQQMQNHNDQQIQHLKPQNTHMANLMGQVQKALQERPQRALPSNTIPSPREEIKVITTRSVQPSPSSRPYEIPPPPISSSFELPKRNPHEPQIPYPLRLNKEKLQDKSDIQEKLLGLANTSLTKNCSAVLLKKLPEKLGDPGKFLIPCDFPELEKCMVLADLGASINLMPLSVLDEDISLQVGRPFLRTVGALVDVYEEELILRDGDEKLIFHADSTSKHPHKHGNKSINMINFIDISCEDRFQEVLKIKKSNHPLSGSPTPSSNPVVESLFPYLTPFGDIDLLLEKTDTFLSLDDSIPLGIDNGIYDSKIYILFLEELLNDEIPRDLPPKELKDDEPSTTKEPPDTFIIGDEEIKFYPFKDIDDLVLIPNVFETPLDSFDSSLDSFDTAFTNPLFELDSEYTLNYDNPIFDIQNGIVMLSK
ncbi:hypothetical protein Tco_0460856 [Tanacetum coccineum]